MNLLFFSTDCTICSTNYVVAVVQSDPRLGGWPPAGSTRQRTECFNLISRLTPLLPNPCVLACHSSRQLWYILIQWGDRGFYPTSPSTVRTPSVVCRAAVVIDGDNWLRNPPHPKDKPTLFRCMYVYMCSCMPAVRRNKEWEAAIFLETQRRDFGCVAVQCGKFFFYCGLCIDIRHK